jgi:hypothetical protein
MSHEPKKKRLWSRAWIWWVAALLALYPLSIGPAFLLCAKTNSGAGLVLFGVAYAPLIWVCEQSPALKSAMRSYLDWWLHYT